MTIDEAIKHCEEVAEENEKNAKSINNIYKKSCLECASEHRQLAEWLKELKAYRTAYEKMRQLPLVWEYGQGVMDCITLIEDCLYGGKR